MKTDLAICVGDEVEVSDGPKFGDSTSLWFVIGLRLGDDGGIQASFAKPDTSLRGAPASAIVRCTGRRWAPEERAAIVGYQKRLTEQIREDDLRLSDMKTRALEALHRIEYIVMTRPTTIDQVEEVREALADYWESFKDGDQT